MRCQEGKLFVLMVSLLSNEIFFKYHRMYVCRCPASHEKSAGQEAKVGGFSKYPQKHFIESLASWRL